MIIFQIRPTSKSTAVNKQTWKAPDAATATGMALVGKKDKRPGRNTSGQSKVKIRFKY